MPPLPIDIEKKEDPTEDMVWGGGPGCEGDGRDLALEPKPQLHCTNITKLPLETLTVRIDLPHHKTQLKRRPPHVERIQDVSPIKPQLSLGHYGQTEGTDCASFCLQALETRRSLDSSVVGQPSRKATTYL